MPHRLPLHVQARRLPLIASDPIIQPFHDLVARSSLLRELDRRAASIGVRRRSRLPARFMRVSPILD